MVDAVVKKTLETKQAELQLRLQAIKKDLQKSYSQDFSEQAVERENDDVLQALVIETEVELKKIATALQRIEDGLYGACQSCGEAISAERLAVIPESNTCIKCAQ